MTRVSRLPPPPAVPLRSPPAEVSGEELLTIRRANGEPSIEARVRAPATAERAVLLCHPHPLYGGSMHSPVVLALARYLVEVGGDRVATLRFSFRGVGASGGKYDDGRGETDDARAALAELRSRAPNVPVTVCGHSFGSWVGLRAATLEGGVDRVALVAPSTRFFDFKDEPAKTRDAKLAIVIGDQDEFCDVDEARALAATLGAELDVMAGFDHHFLKSRRKMAERVVAFAAPELAR